MFNFIDPAWIKGLLKRLLKIRLQREAEYNRITDVNGSDPLLLAKYYVQPNCQHKNPANYDEDEARMEVREPVFRLIDDFLNREFQIRDGRSQLFILSDAGMGKTSLLTMLKLAHLTSFWPKGYECELLKLGKDTLDVVQDLNNARNTVLLLDALDEDPLAWGRIEERLLELLDQTKHFHRVILSCRTQFFPEGEADPFGGKGWVEIGGMRSPMLFLSLFDDRQVDAYLHKRYPTRWWHFSFYQGRQVEAKRRQAWEILRQTGSLRFRPLLLRHVDDLLSAGEQRRWDEYKVYQALVGAWLRREEEKFRLLHPNAKKLPNEHDLLQACVRVAEYMQRMGTRVITEDELEQLIQADRRIRWLKDFDVGGRSLLNRNSDQAFRFSHYTVQEFLLAFGLMEKRLQSSERLRATNQLLSFLFYADKEESWLPQLDLEKNVNFADYVRRCPREGRDLRGHDFSEANLRGAVLRNANLQGASLRGADLHGADLYGANTEGADWWEVKLEVIQDSLKSGGLGPEMVVLPAGKLLLDAKTERRMTLDSFAVGCYPVTFEDYERFCAATRHSVPNDRGWGRGRRPVINVTWFDAMAYCEWLSEQTGYTYRLPTEAEWEYAARAGSAGEYCFGNDEKDLAEYAWYDKNSGKQTHPVGEKKFNAWGLYDVHGNVWEWTVSPWEDKYKRQAFSSIKDAKQGTPLVIRGGSWGADAGGVRASCRYGRRAGDRNDVRGFRPARIF